MCDLEAIGVSSIFKTIRSAVSLVRMLPTLDLRTRSGGSASWFTLVELLKLGIQEIV